MKKGANSLYLGPPPLPFGHPDCVGDGLQPEIQGVPGGAICTLFSDHARATTSRAFRPLNNTHRDGKYSCRHPGSVIVVDEKTADQLSYVLHPTATHTFLKACPGAGKTEVVGLKMSYEIATGSWGPAGIATLTFTNNAAEVIADRVTQFTGQTGYPHFIGTLDAWIHRYILSPFGYLFTNYKGKDGDHSYRIIDNTSDSHFLSNYETHYQYAQQGHVRANQCYFDPKGKTGTWIFSSGQYAIDQQRNSTAPPEFFKSDLKATKRKFWADGFATHADVEEICGNLLNSNSAVRKLLSQRFPVIIVDECQDLSWIQMAILDFLRREGTTLHFVGDVNQSIYRFKKVDPLVVLEFVKKWKFSSRTLQHNFRCDSSIVRLCGQLLDQGNVTGVDYKLSNRSCILFTYKPESISESTAIFGKLVADRGIDRKGACIVTRGRSLLSKLSPYLKSRPSSLKLQECLATALQLGSDGDSRTNNDALTCLGRFVARKFFATSATDARHHYCPVEIESAMKWRLYLFAVLKSTLRTNLADLTQTWAVWSKNVRGDFSAIANQHIISLSEFNVPNAFPSLTGSTFRCPPGKKDAVVSDTLPAIARQDHSIRATTIHDVKGETFDALLLVSSYEKRGDGTHWSHWLADKDSEHARFAYVASSRPRKLLAWAISHGDIEDAKQQLLPLGFAFHESVQTQND